MSSLQVKFRCRLCGYLYSRKDTLKDHIRGKHATVATTDLNSLVDLHNPATVNMEEGARRTMAETVG